VVGATVLEVVTIIKWERPAGGHEEEGRSRTEAEAGTDRATPADDGERRKG